MTSAVLILSAAVLCLLMVLANYVRENEKLKGEIAELNIDIHHLQQQKKPAPVTVKEILDAKERKQPKALRIRRPDWRTARPAIEAANNTKEQATEQLIKELSGEQDAPKPRR